MYHWFSRRPRGYVLLPIITPFPPERKPFCHQTACGFLGGTCPPSSTPPRYYLYIYIYTRPRRRQLPVHNVGYSVTDETEPTESSATVVSVHSRAEERRVSVTNSPSGSAAPTKTTTTISKPFRRDGGQSLHTNTTSGDAINIRH